MELVFLTILFLLMMSALISGFPVAFSLPGSAIISIGLAALFGYMLEGNVNSYFVEGGPIQWLSAGVTNFRSLYWDVERDTLIAIPLFIFMGIMLQRSKIAEDLLVAMAQLFGPVPGGLGISVVLVGALLAATTGIVGATVIAMGMISLPAMLRNNYSKPLATGTICASGTLGQIIPPSIVLIILADQLSSATDQASTTRAAAYKAATGEFSMPSTLDITSTSAGEMFMGALVPGLVLVALYIAYILFVALVKAGSAPPVPYDGKYDREFIFTVMMALIPPLALIFAVLGSIIMGVATVNQAGAIGAVGAMVMGGYRLTSGQRNSYYPAYLAIGSTIVILIILSFYDLNVKSIKTTEDAFGIFFAVVAVCILLVAVVWSAWRIYKIEDALHGVMVETAKTTSMVFVILIGAAMLTSAFRGFGGEELVKDFLADLPGGFWAQFIVVMSVIFLLGFFLDFIEIAVVVVPIIAPILLADPEANVTAVWLGVMVGLNIQTSFLTPPFGFALFYLRGVAPPAVKTTHIYRGAMPFIGLQLVALVIVAVTPSMVNYLPYRTSLTSDTAPPPINPRLQYCIEEQVFATYDREADQLRSQISLLQKSDVSFLPKKQQKDFQQSLEQALGTFDLVAKIRAADLALAEYTPTYRPLHEEVRSLQSEIRDLEEDIVKLERELTRYTRSDSPPKDKVKEIEAKIAEEKNAKEQIEKKIPENWEESRKTYVTLSKTENLASSKYRTNVDSAYQKIEELKNIIGDVERLSALEPQLRALEAVISSESAAEATARFKLEESALGEIAGSSTIKSKFSKARRALKGKSPKPEKAIQFVKEGMEIFSSEIEWRRQAHAELGPALETYINAIKNSIGLRMQKRLTVEQAEAIASCKSIHRDISLHF
ncbi:MAG: TRAP transporter large permease subunit [SAR324 cluster bacterium]|nr:TRAP transporter large permease subunit [SAR324 cluster bacterium]